MTSEDVRRALNEVGLPETATLADLIRHHRAQAALAAALEASAVSSPSEDVRALIDAADAMTVDEVHQHPYAALDKMRGLTRELRAALEALAVSTPETVWEYGIRIIGTSKWVPTTAKHVAEVQAWHNGIYEFARRTAPGDWQPLPNEGEA